MINVAASTSPSTSFCTVMLIVIGVVVPAKIGKGSAVKMVTGPVVTLNVLLVGLVSTGEEVAESV
jgi:hypothetical protein